MHRSTVCRAGALIATLALAIGATACGNDNGGDSNGAGASASQASNDGGTTPAGSGRSGREAEVEDTLTSIQAEFVKGQGTAYCDRLTKAGQRQVVTFAKAFAIDGNCAQAIKTFATNTRKSGIEQKPTKLVSVKFDGNRAIATVRDGRRPPKQLILINQDGDWKIPNPGFKDALTTDKDQQPPANPAQSAR